MLCLSCPILILRCGNVHSGGSLALSAKPFPFTAHMTAPSPLRALSNLIVSGVDVIETAYANHQATFPSLDDPFRPPPFDDRELVESANLVIAAAAQLIACLRPPVDTILFTAQSVSNSALNTSVLEE